ncbi:MAG: glycosyltransferase family 4 protein [Candidatus Omnitrophota bacterium]
MKILILTNHLNLGGVSVYVCQLAARLAAGHGAKVFVASRGGDLQESLRAAGVSDIRIPLTTKCEFSPKVLFSALKLLPVIRREKIDVIHANTRVTQVLGSLLSLATGKPMLSTCHGYFKRRLSRLALPCWGRRVIAISDQVRDHLIYDFDVEAERINLIYNGVEAGKFIPRSSGEIRRQKGFWGIEAGQKVAGHIGRLSSVKGQATIVLAAEALKQKRPDLRWIIVGDGKEGPRLKELITARGVQNIVRIFPSQGDTSLALASMDVFVMPSLQEGLGISILEAQAQGVPVVASRVGGIPTVIEDGATGLLVPPQDPRSLAQAVEKFLDEPDWASGVVRKARLHVTERFSLDIMAEKTYKVYSALAPAKAGVRGLAGAQEA